MGSTKISQPAAPAAPTTTSSVQDWVNNMPYIYDTQMKYAPLEAQQQVDLAQRYAAPLAQAYYDAQKVMYPEAVGMQEQLAAQAKTGMTAGLQDWERQQYQSDLAAQLGNNVGSGLGSDYMSRGMLQQQQQRQDYYRNLGLSVAGLQPVQQATGAQTSNYMAGFTPNAVMSSNNQNYGTMANIYGTQAGMATANAANSNAMKGQWISSAFGAGAGLGSAAMMGSDREIKDNIKELDIKALDIIAEMKPVEFNYKDTTHKTYGFIAQDAPDMITAEDKKSVDLYSCIGLLTKAVQELRADINELKCA